MEFIQYTCLKVCRGGRGRGAVRGTLQGRRRPRNKEGRGGQCLKVKRNCSAINYPVRTDQFQKTENS